MPVRYCVPMSPPCPFFCSHAAAGQQAREGPVSTTVSQQQACCGRSWTANCRESAAQPTHGHGPTLCITLRRFHHPLAVSTHPRAAPPAWDQSSPGTRRTAGQTTPLPAGTSAAPPRCALCARCTPAGGGFHGRGWFGCNSCKRRLQPGLPRRRAGTGSVRREAAGSRAGQELRAPAQTVACRRWRHVQATNSQNSAPIERTCS